MDSAQIFANKDDDDESKYPDAPGIKQLFINPKIVELHGNDWPYNEGCLSLPKIREDIYRAEEVTLEYQDEQFETTPAASTALPPALSSTSTTILKANCLSITCRR
jgi:peptide deformylase